MNRNRLAAIVLMVALVLSVAPRVQGATDTRSYAYSWTEGKLITFEYWNDPSRVALEYAQNPWPQGQFAAERAYVTAARLVMRDGMHITDLLNSLGRKGVVHIHGAESNGHNDHHDYPPHLHLFYEWTGTDGAENMTNSHAYPDAQGKMRSAGVVPAEACGGTYFQPAVDQWLNILDETCGAIWQQRYTSAGDYQVRRSAAGPTFTFTAIAVSGDLAAVEVRQDGVLRWTVTTTAYDGIALRLVVRETDWLSRVVTTETWQGNPSAPNQLASHSVTTSPIAPTPPPTVPPNLKQRNYLPLLLCSPWACASYAVQPAGAVAAATPTPRQLMGQEGMIPVAYVPAPVASPAFTQHAYLPQVLKMLPPTPTPAPSPTPPPGGGQTYYVSTGGNDVNPGSQARPWRTLAKAGSAAQPGDTVYMLAGTYAERLRPARSGTASAWITFAAYPGQSVTLEGTGLNLGTWSGLVDLSGRSYIQVRGLTVQNSSVAGLLADGSQHVIFQGNHTRHSTGSGIGIWNSVDVWADGNDVEASNFGGGNEALTVAGSGPFQITSNRVHNPSSNTTQTLKEGLDIKQGSHDGKVIGNELFNIGKAALYVDAYDKHTYNITIEANRLHDVRMGITLASELGGLLENVAVQNNVVWNVYYAGIRTFDQVSSANHPMQDIRYTNNTVYASGTGINVSNTQITNFVVRNNIVAGNTSAFSFANASLVTQDHNLASGDPCYVNPAAGDFHLRANSPAINAGSGVSAPSSDADGVARPQGAAVDIGAYEYR
jgi:hypothetical protein